MGSAGPMVHGGHGGGYLRLWATGTVTIAGQVTANGENGPPGGGYGGAGGGSGGTVVIAGDAVTISGSVVATGGMGGAAATGIAGGTGGNGWIFVLSGASRTVTGSLTGAAVQGLLPPLLITSSTHPIPTLFYNNDTPVAAFSWNPSFPSRQGYYWLVDTQPYTVPTPATGHLALSELVSVDHTALAAGTNYIHIVSVDATSSVGAVQNSFVLQLNTTPPAVSSTSHPSPSTWSPNHDVFYTWTVPNTDANYRGDYYVLDHYGDTIPTAATGTFLPITQKQLLRSGLADGIWGFHVVSVDTLGYLTRTAGHYQVRLGADPGNGTLLGNVANATGGAPLAGATVTINRGLFPPQVTNSAGNYNFTSVPAGTWEVRISQPGFATTTGTVTVTAAMSTSFNAMLTAM
jgi:hypothetical protein